jgi:hypothetical protein
MATLRVPASLHIAGRPGPTSGLGPGCVKTCTSRECAELFSLFSSFDGDCQSGSFLIQRNRDKLSTRKFDAGVFTQPGSSTDLAAPKFDFRSSKSDIEPCQLGANFGSDRTHPITSSARDRNESDKLSVVRALTFDGHIGLVSGDAAR